MSAKITGVRVEFRDGSAFEFEGDDRFGDNPRFYSQQADLQLDIIKWKIRKAFEGLYGKQEV